MTTALRPALSVALAAALLTAPICGADLAESMALLERLERVQVSIDASDERLDRVVADLAAAAGVVIRVDWDALDTLGVDSDDRISLTVRDVSAESALHALTLSVGLAGDHPIHDAAGGQVVITAANRSGPLRCTDVYDLRPLLASSDAESALRAQVEAREAAEEARSRDSQADEGAPKPPPHPLLGPDPVDQGGGAPAGGAADGADAPPRSPPASRAARLARLILEHVDPEAWMSAGGLRGRIDDQGDTLVVTASPRVHRQVRRLLNQLTSLQSGSLQVEMAVVAVDRGALDLATRRHDPGSPALARAVLALAAPAAGTDPPTGAAPGLAWRTTAPASPGTPITAKRRDGDRAITFVATPGPVGPDGRVQLAIRCAVTGPDGERSVETTTSVAAHGGAVVADLGDLDGKAVVAVMLLAAR